MIARLRRLSGRFAIMLSGEVLQSVFNFALNIGLARALPAKAYGQFAIVVLIAGLGIVYIRSLIGVPASTFIPQSRSAKAIRAYSVSFGSSALALSAIGGCIAAAALLFWEPCSAIAGGCFVGAWSLRSYIRMVLFAQRQSLKATLSDCAFTLSATALSVPLVLHYGSHLSLQNIFLALTLANAIGIGVALFLLGQPVRVSFRRSVRIRFRKLLPAMSWSIVSVTMSNIQSQGPAFLIAALAGPADYAPIAATLAFFSPLRMASSALQNMIQPDLSLGLSGREPHRLPRRLLHQSGVIGAICLAFGLVMAIVFPILAARLFADRFAGAPLAMIALLLWSIATVAVSYSVPKTVMETVLDFRGTTIIAFWAALVGLPLAAWLALTVSPASALLGLFVSEVMGLVGCWIGAMRAITLRCERIVGMDHNEIGHDAVRKPLPTFRHHAQEPVSIERGRDAATLARSLWRGLRVPGTAAIQDVGPRV